MPAPLESLVRIILLLLVPRKVIAKKDAQIVFENMILKHEESIVSKMMAESVLIKV